MGSDEIAQRLKSAIELEYVKGNYGLGWRLLSCPIDNIQSAKICFIGLNPAGKCADFENDGLSSEIGSSYKFESWGKHLPGEAPLQKQICKMFEFLGVSADEVLSGNLIPFRSPRFADLPNRKRAVDFSKAIWREILTQSSAELVICMGNDVTRSVAQLLKINSLEKLPSGWGEISIYVGDKEDLKVIGLPHLSTFKLFSRLECQSYLNDAFNH